MDLVREQKEKKENQGQHYTYNAAATTNSESFITSSGNTTRYAALAAKYKNATEPKAAADAFGRLLIGSYIARLLMTNAQTCVDSLFVYGKGSIMHWEYNLL